jgi:hypothetical protein
MPPNFIRSWNDVDTGHWLSGRMEPRVTQEDCHHWNDQNRVNISLDYQEGLSGVLLEAPIPIL